MKEKGIDQYLEAAEYIGREYPNTHFHICGSCSDEYKDVLAQQKYKDCVTYHGAVKDMLPIYQMSSCTIHPTYYPEGMSNVLLESCASARPIITTDRPGCKEIVDDAVNGYIVREKDAGDLIKKIEKFLALTCEQKKEMGLRGRAKVEREFNRDIVVNKYMQEITDCGRI
jgi:galacturonosyltransferase